MLNVILWIALLVSIPPAGFNPLYVTAAIVGVFIMGPFAAIVIGADQGRGQSAERALRAVARRVKWLDEERSGAVVKRLASRLRELMSDPQLLRRVVLWAIGQLAARRRLAVGLPAGLRRARVRPDGLFVAFGLANVLAALPITPGGLGIVEGVLIPTLVGFGADRTSAALGVASYRLVQYWLTLPVGGVAYFTPPLRALVDRPGPAAWRTSARWRPRRRRVGRSTASSGPSATSHRTSSTIRGGRAGGAPRPHPLGPPGSGSPARPAADHVTRRDIAHAWRDCASGREPVATAPPVASGR